MFNRLANSKNLCLIAAFALVASIGLTGCGSEDSTKTSQVTPQGTVELDTVAVGSPEDTFKEAIFTFVPDPKGSSGDTTQYLSRSYDKNGGQYIAKCKDNNCFLLQVFHTENPIPTEAAKETLQKLLPDGAPAQSRVDDSRMSEDIPVRVFYFGDKYRGELIFADKEGETVRMVSMMLASPDEAKIADKGEKADKSKEAEGTPAQE